MTKADIVNCVQERLNISRKESASAVEAILAALKRALIRGEKVKISGFGNFVVRNKTPRVGRNMWTNEFVVIGARRSLTFKPSHLLKDRLNAQSTQSLGKLVRGEAVGEDALSEKTLLKRGDTMTSEVK